MIVFISSSAQELAQVGEITQVGDLVAAPPVETILSRTGDLQVHQRVEEKIVDGQRIQSTNQWTLLQPGIGYWSDQESLWKPTSDEIELAEVGAIYRKGSFQLQFPPDYNAAPIEFTLPDKRVIKFQTVGLALTDSASGDSVWLGEARPTAGFLDKNTIVYPDCFNGIKADLVAKVGIGRWENDIVLREQTLSPEALGWKKENTRLEIWHRIVQMPAAEANTSVVQRADGTADLDDQLSFGNIILAPGTAFLVGTNQTALSTAAGEIPVSKERFTDDTQTTYLIEKVPFAEAAAHLATLPARQEARLDRETLRQRLKSTRSFTEKGKRLKPVSLASVITPSDKRPAARKVAAITRKAIPAEPGFVMDYTWLQSASNFRFEGDKTYYCTNDVGLTGTTVLEGGTVVKYPPYNAASRVVIYGKLDCQTTPVSPAVFTADADNSVGEVISTNALSGYYGRFNLYFPASTNVLDLHDIRTGYAYWGVSIYSTNTPNLANIQVINDYYGIEAYNNTVNVQNLLGQSNVVTFYGNNMTYRAEHCTVHSGNLLFAYNSGGSGSLYLTNSLVVGMTYASTGVTSDHVTNLTSDSGVFQKVRAGAHYLPAKNQYIGKGSTALSARMQAILQSQTTSAPLELTNSIIGNTTLTPRVERGNLSAPTLGYHYPAIDYLCTALDVNTATLTLSNGVSVAFYGPKMFRLLNGAKIASQGRPTKLNRLIPYNSVQEQPEQWITSVVGIIDGYAVNLNRTEVSFMAGPSAYYRTLVPDGPFNGTCSLADCVLHNVHWFVWNSGGSGYSPNIAITNTLLRRCSVDWEQSYGSTAGFLGLTLQNNTFYRGAVTLYHWGSSYGGWSLYDNLFDNSTNTFTQVPTDYPYADVLSTSDYNGYTASAATFLGTHNKTTLTSGYDTGYLGSFYLPVSGATNTFTALIDAGSKTNASLAGLYHYTTQTNQMKEGISRLDIGFHYPAADSAGNPVDSDGDGIADLDEDKNANGAIDTGETSFVDSDTDMDGVSDSEELRIGTNPLDITSVDMRRLGTWKFLTKDFTADTGQPAWVSDYVSFETNFSGFAVALKLTNSALQYRETKSSGAPNINRGFGSVQLWFKPTWTTSTNLDVFPSSNPGQLICMGQPSTNKDNWWSLHFSPKGDALIWETQAGGVARTNLSTSINWTNGGWYQVLLSYTRTGVSLYTNGVLATTNSLPTLVPVSAYRANERLCFGSFAGGGGVAQGSIDEVQTSNYIPSLEEIQQLYPGPIRFDDPDHDGMSTLDELAHVPPLDPFKRDTDGDGMPDGWEVNAIKMAPAGYSGQVLNANTNTDANLDFDGDGISNLREFWLGTNPYVANAAPATLLPNKAQAQSYLINLDFGTGSTITGWAAAGYNTNDYWNKIGPGFSGKVLPATSSTNSTVQIYLRQTLGHVFKNLLPCSTTYTFTVTNETNPFCTGMMRTNAFGGVECCVPDSSVPPYLFYEPFNALQQFANSYNRWSQRLFWYDSTFRPEAYVLPANVSTNICVTSSGFLNYGATIGTRNTRDYGDGWGWKLQLPLSATSDLYHTIWGPGFDGRNIVVTNVQQVTMTRPVYPEGYPAEVIDQADFSGHPLVVNAALGWTVGFNVAGSFSSGTGLRANAMIADYLTSSFDYDVSLLPQSSDCNSYRFLRDGHAQILITGVTGGYYRLYLYSSTPNDTSAMGINVSGQATVRLPVVGANQTNWNLNAYGGATVLAQDGTITLDFSTNHSAMNGLQLMRLQQLSTPSVTVEANEVYGAVVRFAAPETATSFVVRRKNAATGEIETFRTWSSVFTDPQIPRNVTVTYSVRAENEVPELASEWSSEVSPPSPLANIQSVNHAPTVRGEVYLTGAYKNTAFSFGAPILASVCDAFDIDGDSLSFCITDLGEGTLKVRKSDGTITQITTNDLTNLSLTTVGADATLIWLPPTDASEQSVPAFSIRAFDGMYLSASFVPVSIYVKGPTAVMWWGSSSRGYTGDGTLPFAYYAKVSALSQSSYTGPMEFWNNLPTPVLVKGSSGNAANQWLTNIVEFAGFGDGCRIARRADGTIWSWGDGRFGLLGDGKSFLPTGGTSAYPVWFTTEELKAIQVTNLTSVVSVAAGDAHVIAAKADGSVWGWGMTEYGLGEVVGQRFMLGTYLTNGWSQYDLTNSLGFGYATSTPSQIPGLANVVQVAAGGTGSAALTSNGQVYWWGEIYDADEFNIYEYARTEFPRLLDIPGRAVQIAMGYNFILALNDAGEVYSWGLNKYGQLGLGYTSGFEAVPKRVPQVGPVGSISASGYAGAAVLQNGQVAQWGDGVSTTPRRVPNLREIVKVVMNDGTTLALDNHKRLFAWGANFNGITGLEWNPNSSNFDSISDPVLVDTVDQLDDVISLGVNSFGAMRLDKLSPRGLQTISRSNLVEVSWHSFSGASSYELQRSVEKTNDVEFHTIAIIPHNPGTTHQSYVDTTVTNGTSYMYRVSAISQNGDSFFCDPVEAIPSNPPGQVTTIVATPLSRQIKVAWSRALPANNYEVFRSDNGGPFKPFQFVFDGAIGYGGFSSDTSKVTIVDYSATGTNSYSYSVRATNMAGFGPMSPASSNVTVLTQTLTPPSSLTLAISTGGSADLTWQMSDPSWVGTFWVRAYELNGTNIAGTIEPLKITQGTNATIPRLNPGRTNLFEVSAVDEVYGESALVSTQKAWWPGYTVTNSITFLTVKGGPGFVYLKWKGSAVNYGATTTPSTGVECTYKVIDPDSEGIAEYFAANLPATNYQMGVLQFYDSYGSGVATTTNVTVTSGVFTNLPTLKVIPGNNRALVTWWGQDSEYEANFTTFQDWRFVLQRKEDADPAPGCSGYWTIYDTGDPFYNSKFTMGVVDSEVANGHSYHYRIYGISPAYDVVLQTLTNQFTPFETFPSTNVFTVTPTPENGGVSLAWTFLTNASGYHVDYSHTQGGPYTFSGQTAPNVLTFEDRGLPNGVTIYYTVTATNVNGDTFTSSEVAATPTESSAMMKAAGFNADLHSGLLYITWDAVPGADSYSIWQTNFVKSLSTPEFVITYATNISQYRYDVKALRRGATSTQSITAETIAWNAVTNAVLYNVAVVENGATNTVAQRTVNNFQYVRLGTFTSLGSYIITAYDAAGSTLSTTTSVYAQGPISSPTVATNEATIQLVGLGTSSSAPLRINSPTNFVLRARIQNHTLGSNGVSRVEYFSDGIFVGATKMFLTILPGSIHQAIRPEPFTR
jgi:alpha-tubulin suppressor-like RCC1 family protein